ncbi:TonB-dependent receptor [Emticicia agri]|uniref:TonB-dependent receptor n=1 Tax=Emticicia agri TaxID=2492393 RepID=A0A4Q5M0Y9_9BACT|nr:TonB-dependent receptor [Emticicia agri]RYU95669.1 TonB-dependent receptor [Emticicia agri]
MKFKSFTISLFLITLSLSSFAQETETDTITKQLSEVIVRGFESGRKLTETAASVGVLTIKDIERFQNTTLVPVFNTLPGVRMEERSPGSYRLSIRGSSIRSPFGVRNVKIYWNDIPLTDGNGNTFLNAIDMNTVGNIEVIKGPAGSIYGAGTGGVLLLGSNKADASQNAKEKSRSYINTSLGWGSYGLHNRAISWNLATEKINSVVSYAHVQSDGYRENSALVRDVLSWRSNFFVSSHKTLNVSALYSDMKYQTPGGLTQAQMDANPRSARPSTPVIPGPIAQKAGIYQKLFNLGLSQEYRFNERWTNVTAIYGMFSELQNPFITNYEIRNEQTFGGRTRSTYAFRTGNLPSRLTFGGEFQKSDWVIRNFGNRGGKIDTLQTNDNVGSWSYFLFTQLETDLPQDFILTIGASYNRVKYDFLRISDAPNIKPIDKFLPSAFLPRIALLKKIKDKVSIFASISSGFSPPLVNEFIAGYQSTSFLPSLASERGINYEIGTRGYLFNRRLSFDATAYAFRLQNTIVRRVDEAGSEIFTNAGGTLQNGLEISLNSWLVRNTEAHAIHEVRLFTSYTLADYQFKNYTQLQTDLSGKSLTGVPRNIWVSGLDMTTKPGFYLNSTINFTDRLPVNDANTVYANSYWLLNARIGYQQTFKPLALNIYVGGDNLLNQLYSLGNDLNPVGNRFFNPAPTRNWQVGGNVRIYL